MEFRTRVELPEKGPEIKHSDSLMLWGSCFAENVGNLLTDNKFSCDVNPFGILYNPLSIAKALQQLLEEKVYELSDLEYRNGQWFSLMHHTSFSSADSRQTLQCINERLESAARSLKTVNWMIFTWGTARVYEWKENGEVVGNCHKLPDRLFSRRLLEVDEITRLYTPLLDRIRQVNPGVRFLFTVSPIRHAKDGMHGNQLSKATLLLAADYLCSRYSDCHYFPSYEIMMDELRDYRFYADDMLHPSPLSIPGTSKRFTLSFFFFNHNG